MPYRVTSEAFYGETATVSRHYDECAHDDYEREDDFAWCEECGATAETFEKDVDVDVDEDGPYVVGSTFVPVWEPPQYEEDGERCADCGEYGAATGHMECQYPQERG